MKRQLILSMFILNAFVLTKSFAGDKICPTAEQLKSEWSPTSIQHIEKTQDQIVFYQSPHHYGTNKSWYVNLTIRDTDVDRALNEATQAVKNATFVGGGITPFGFYSCQYISPKGYSIYALSNTGNNTIY